jgi:cytochrome c oxidase subunit 2
MFSGASNLVEGVDRTFVFIFSIAFIFITGITVFMIYTVIHFSRKKGKAAQQFSGSVKLEVIWTVIPLILVLMMFYYGWIGYAPMHKVPADAMPVTAIGRMWQWEFDYSNGIKSKELVIPVNKPVRLNLKSADVNHSLFIPAFRVKEDAIPGYNNFLWFIPKILGTYEILCTEYCGLLHSSMLSKARVLEQSDYDTWYNSFKDSTIGIDPAGYLILRNTGCLACHTLDGTKLVGPSFKGLYGKEQLVTAGDKTVTITADEKYIQNSVYDPDSQIVSGFNKGIMKSYKDILKESDIKIITDYLKTLKEQK